MGAKIQERLRGGYGSLSSLLHSHNHYSNKQKKINFKDELQMPELPEGFHMLKFRHNRSAAAWKGMQLDFGPPVTGACRIRGYPTMAVAKKNKQFHLLTH